MGKLPSRRALLSPPFDPHQAPGLALYLRSDLGIGLNGSNVSAWADQSGKANNASQPTAANQPLYVTGAQNGKPCLRFNGTSHQLALANLFASLTATVYAVYTPTSTASTTVVLSEANSALNNSRKFTLDNSGADKPRIFLRDDAGTNIGLTAATTKAGSALLFSGTVGTPGAVTTTSSYYNGAFNASGTVTLGAITTNTARVGSRNNGTEGQWFLGDLYALLYYTAAHPDGQRKQMEGWLNALYRLF